MMESDPYCGVVLSKEIRRLIKQLRVYIGDFKDKYGNTLNMLKLLEEKLESVHLDDMEGRGRCKPKMELPYSEWMWELFRASERVAEMLEVMGDVVAMKKGVSASEAVSRWLRLDDNLLSMKYEVGSLTSICARGELLIAFPGPSNAESSQIALPSPIKCESPLIAFPSSSKAGSSPTAVPCSMPCSSEASSQVAVSGPSKAEPLMIVPSSSKADSFPRCSSEAPSQTAFPGTSKAESSRIAFLSSEVKPSPVASGLAGPIPDPCSGEYKTWLNAFGSSEAGTALQSLEANPLPSHG